MKRSRLLALALLFGVWWCSMLVAGLWVHVPILALFTPLVSLAALASWLGFFALLAPAASADSRHVTVPARILAWTLAVVGGVLLVGTVTSIGAFIGDELLALQRFMFELHMRHGGPRRDYGLQLLAPLLSHVRLQLAWLMALWLVEIAVVCFAVRLRADWRRPQLLLLGAALLPLPLLIPFLVLLFDLPMTA